MYAQNIIQEKIITPAMKDEAFRQRLLSSPKMVLEREPGITLPQGVNVQVHEETPATLHFVLPKSHMQRLLLPGMGNWSRQQLTALRDTAS